MNATTEAQPRFITGARAIAAYLSRTERATFQQLERGQITGAAKQGGRWMLDTRKFERSFAA